MIHLLIFIILTVILIIFPSIAKNRKEKAVFFSNLNVSKDEKINRKKFESGLIYFMGFFEYLFRNNFGVQFFWTTGFISWILGCCLWVLKSEFTSLIFISISIILCLIALYDSSKITLNEFFNLKTNELSVSIYILIIFISVVIMIGSNSIAFGLTSNILLMLLLHDFKVYRKAN